MELPDYLEKALETVKESDAYLFGSDEGATGMCVAASDELLFMCDEIKGSTIDGYVDGDNRPHHWAVIEGICVDLTARQFNENEPFPKIWKNTINE